MMNMADESLEEPIKNSHENNALFTMDSGYRQQQDVLNQFQMNKESVPKKNYDETKIQVRLLDGQKLEQTFKSKEPLSAVRVFVQMNRPASDGTVVKLMTSFPRKVFTEEDYEKPLEVLGLCPSAVVIQSK